MTDEPEGKIVPKIKVEDLDQADIEELKKTIIHTAVQLSQNVIREELDKLWMRLQDIEAQTEINTKSNASTLAVVRNHVHEPIQKKP